MRRVAIIVVLIALIIFGVGYLAINDEHAATEELGALQTQVLALQKEADGNPNKEQLNRIAIQLGDIRSELSDLPSRHRLAFLLFGNMQTNVSAVDDQLQRVAISVNQRR